VYKIYFGRGDGHSSKIRKLLFSFKQIVTKKTSSTIKHLETKDNDKEKPGFTSTFYKCLNALLVAFEKKRNLKFMQKAKKKGMLVICDRFPQNQFYGFNDGPLLHHLMHSSNLLVKAAANLERRIYDLIETNHPDVMFKLIAGAEIVAARKPGETTLPLLEKKIAATQLLQVAINCKVITIDATQPLKMVLTTIKKTIWDNYK
jgi:thymidylate kinase